MPSKDLPERTRLQANEKARLHEKEDVDLKNQKESNHNEKETSTCKGNAVACTQIWEEEVYMRNGQEEYKRFQANENKSYKAVTENEAGDEAFANNATNTTPTKGHHSENEQTIIRQGRGANSKVANKRQKTNTDGEPRGIAGDKTRVPAQGQKVQWKELSGIIDGEVDEVVYEEKTVDGKSVKGSKEDPHIVLTSKSSGEVSIHKPDAIYFD